MNIKQTLISLLCLFFIICPGPLNAERLNLLENKQNFLSTGANNSLDRARKLFSLRSKGKNQTLKTDSEEINIHSHYRANRATRFKNYTYSGRMKIGSAASGIGVTFYSDYPKSDTYYRLRMYNGGTFHLAPHPDDSYTFEGTTDTGIIPEVGVWQNFKIIVKSRKNATRIRAKVWALGEKEPKAWQIDCTDSGENRLKRGKPGVWSMAEGRKSWSRLVVKVKR